MKAYVCTLLMAVALLTVIGCSSALAQDKAKWTGTWKMVPEKSQFANGGGPSSIVIKLELKDGAVTETMTLNGDHSFTATYTTDGKAKSQEVMGNVAETSAKWNGDALSIDFKHEKGGFARTITLSPDGKTMTIAVHHSGENGEADETVILEKQ